MNISVSGLCLNNGFFPMSELSGAMGYAFKI